ncbi:MAG: RNA-guided endonuclease TnpB family protein, partial [Asgard group archaeon]
MPLALAVFKYLLKQLNSGETLRLKKSMLLNCLPLTAKKEQFLDSFFVEYLRVLNETFKHLPEARSSTELHHLTYSNIRSTSFLPSDIVQEARKDGWARRKTVKNGFKGCSIRLNKRWFRFFETFRGTPCFKITYSPRKSFVIPVKLDNGYERFKEFLEDSWKIKCISLLNGGKIAVCIEKDFPEPPDTKRRNIIGIDIGSSTLATVTVFDSKTSKVVKQLYFGRDVAQRQRRYEERRGKLRSYADKGSRKAKKYLGRLKTKQRNFVKTRSGQIAKEIVNLALENNASISIEKLSIRGKKRKFNRKANRKINRIPYAQFREFLKSNCIKHGIPLREIDSYHTSKWCPHCGAVNKGRSSPNYALYICKKCGLVVNSDRKASLAIAIKSLLEQTSNQGFKRPSFVQISKRRVPVNG